MARPPQPADVGTTAGAPRLEVVPGISIPEAELRERLIQAGGPGGQNVNKVATAVVLRVDLAKTELRPAVRTRLIKLAGTRATKSGELVIKADRHRTQARNRADALTRLAELVEQAHHQPKPRRPTKLKPAVKRRRLDTKGRRGALKKLRSSPPAD